MHSQLSQLITPDSKVLLLGYGKEGQSIHRYFHEHYPEISIAIADQREKIQPLYRTEVLYVGTDYLNHLPDYDLVFRTPSIPFYKEEIQHAIQDGKTVTSAINLFFSLCPGKIIGITGTKGKSTTASLITHFLKQQLADVRLVGNIGKPALDFLDGSTEKTIFVVELSSYQLEDLQSSPHYAVLLSISQEHLDHHGNFENYLEAKSHIFSHQTANDYLIFDEDNQWSKKLANTAKSHTIGLSTKKGLSFLRRQESLTEINPSLIGQSYLTNVAAASAVAKLFDISDEQIVSAIKNFQPLPHRLEFIGETQGIKFYDDSIATIPEATMNALEALGKDVETLIVGGHDRGIDYDSLGKYLATSSIKNLIVFSPSGDRIAEALGKYRQNQYPEIFEAETMEQAVNIALHNTGQGKICLLSPASASFGQFRDYVDRGNQFRKLLGFELKKTLSHGGDSNP